MIRRQARHSEGLTATEARGQPGSLQVKQAGRRSGRDAEPVSAE